MNIVLINHYAGSPDMGMEFRPYYMAREWVKAGHTVTIIAGDYSHLRTQNPKVERDFQEEMIDGINYCWVRTGQYHGSGVKRALTMGRFVGKLWLYAGRISKKYCPNVVIASSTYPLDTYAAQKIAQKSNAKIIHEIHDMWPATLIELGGMSKLNPFVVLMQMAENSFCKQADVICSLAPNSQEYLMSHGMDENKFISIPNGIVAEEWDNPQPLDSNLSSKLEKWKEEGKFILGYFGGHALSNNLMILMELAFQMKDENVKFVLIGHGIEKEKLIKYTVEKKMENVYFGDAILKRQIPAFTEKVDALYIGAKKSSLYRFGVCPNKLFDAMMAGKPILYAIEAPNNYVEQYNCGITVNSDDIEDMKRGMSELLATPAEKRKTMGQNGKTAVQKHFQYEILAKKFLEIMQ